MSDSRSPSPKPIQPQESRPPHRIAFCITELDPGGAEKNLVQLVTRLDRRRWEPRVFCLASEGPLAQPLRDAGIAVICLNASRRFGAASTVWRLARHLQQFRPALLQTFLFHANLVGRLAGRWAGVPRIVSGIRVAEKDAPVRLRLDRWTNRLVDKNVCVSRGVAEFSVRHAGLDSRKCVVIPNGVDLAEIDRVPPADITSVGVPPGHRAILFVGRLAPQKAPELLLEAAELVLPRFPDVHVLFVGEGPLRSTLQRRAVASSHAERIHFLGRRADVIGLMKASSCLALTSRWEGMPNVVLEAMAAGVPVVATEAEGVSDLVQNGLSGLIVPVGDAPGLAAALSRLLSDSTLSSSLAHESQVIVRKWFTVDRLVGAYERLYEELLGAADRSARRNFQTI